MSNPTVRYVRRAIEEARNKGGILAGMPKVTINMADAEGLCIIADQVERLKARVADFRLLAERLQHCAQGFYVDQGDHGYMEAIMQDYHAIMRADSFEGNL